MISKLFKSRVAVNKAFMINQANRNFAALSLSSKSSEVTSSSAKEIGELMKEMSKTPSSQNEGELCEAIDEYFRQKFRKVSFHDAKDIMCGLGTEKNKIQGLDDKFWVWETLEEATRGQVDELSKEEMQSFFKGLTSQTQGSEEIHDLMHERIYFYEL